MIGQVIIRYKSKHDWSTDFGVDIKDRKKLHVSHMKSDTPIAFQYDDFINNSHLSLVNT